MCKILIVDELLGLADEMASAAASFGTQQGYQQFIESRDRIMKRIEKLKECSTDNDPLAQ